MYWLFYDRMWGRIVVKIVFFFGLILGLGLIVICMNNSLKVFKLGVGEWCLN